MSDNPRYERRAFLSLIAIGSGGYLWWSHGAGKSASLLPARATIARFDPSGRFLSLTEVDTIRRTDHEWRRRLAPDAYSVTRLKDTEFAGTGKYDKFYEDGIYNCVCCATALFDSRSKYASGTGWPSFTQPIAKQNVVESPSSYFGLPETEVRCARCDAHLGHVFDDGPPPAGLRYCINSVALAFQQTS